MSSGKKMERFAACASVFVVALLVVLLSVTMIFWVFEVETNLHEFLAGPMERTFSGFWRFCRGGASNREVVTALLEKVAFPLLLIVVYMLGIWKPVLEKRRAENRKLDKTYVWLVWAALSIGLVVAGLRIWHYHCVDMEAQRLMADEGLRTVWLQAFATKLRTEPGEEILLRNWGTIAGAAGFVLCGVLGLAAVWCGQNADEFDNTTP